MALPADPSPATAEFWDLRPGRAAPTPVDEAAVRRLNEVWGLIANPPAFAVGDLVTPRPGFARAGLPHLVVMRDDCPHRDRAGRLVIHTIRMAWLQAGAPRFGWEERWRFDWWAAAPAAAPVNGNAVA